MSKVCKKCGQENADNAVVCSLCGESLGGFSATTRSTPQTSSANTTSKSTFQPSQPTQGYAVPGSKSWIAALLISIFLGRFGIDNFYLGYTQRGILKLALSVIPWFLSWIPVLGVIIVWGGNIIVTIFWILDIIGIATRKLKPQDGTDYAD
jgi:TM2 domain-containing membrane protein YozV